MMNGQETMGEVAAMIPPDIHKGAIIPFTRKTGRKAHTSEPPENIRESLSRKGADYLAKRLEAYWHLRGYTAARFWITPLSVRVDKVGTYDIYTVKCNFLKALPPMPNDTEQCIGKKSGGKE
jgi:hypothetical protein